MVGKDRFSNSAMDYILNIYNQYTPIINFIIFE